MASNLSIRLEDLAHGVLGPMILGGTLRLVLPIGAELGVQLGVDRRIVDDDLRTQIDVARVRRARWVAPVDTLPDLSPNEWALVAALNDLLQSTNHELSSAFTRGRHATLLESTERLLTAVPNPRTTLEVIVRHATFARVLEIERTDTLVRAWAGSIQYRGQEPDPTMTFWPSVRRVSIEPRSVALHAMPEGLEVIPASSYLAVLSELLSKSPLTDLATCGRAAPAFAWSLPTLELVSYPAGRSLALRALCRAPAQSVVAALTSATSALPPASATKPLAQALTTELLEHATSTRA